VKFVISLQVSQKSGIENHSKVVSTLVLYVGDSGFTSRSGEGLTLNYSRCPSVHPGWDSTLNEDTQLPPATFSLPSIIENRITQRYVI
jgi:hypothetical protein